MKKYFILLCSAICFAFSSHAATGDTTWVQANIAQLSWYGNYDSTINFPNTGVSYRKILMIFTLGKYVCPSGSTWCGDWDYTVMNYLMTPLGDTLELGRFITPYANAGAPRTPWTWQQHYVYDVTDYARLLKDSATMRILYSGYSGGFTANIKFAFIEGTPDRDVLAIKRLWHGSYTYGDTTHLDSNDINLKYPVDTLTAPSSTIASELKFTVTGHGSDGNYCNEFCSHNYYVYLNGGVIDTYKIWRSDCGRNELYPQSGTWIYERANWCPGAMVYSEHHKLPGISAGTTFPLDIQFDPYVIASGSGSPSYTTEATIFYYGGYNKTLDASIDQIIAPTLNENNFRENPICGSPVIHVKNTGATHIDSITFRYGVVDSAQVTYTWVGSLNSLQETDIVLPALSTLTTMSGMSGTYNFGVKILYVNGNTDSDPSNDSMTSSFMVAPNFPSSFKIVFQTNNEAIATGSTISETSWFIFDMNNTIMISRANVAISSTYTDTIQLAPGCYKLVVTDSSCDGLQWWGFSGTSITSGTMSVRKMNNFSIPMHGYYTSGTYNNDFGCGFTQFFTINWPAGITELSDMRAGIEAFPNPAKNAINVELTGLSKINGNITIIDVMGRTVIQEKCNQSNKQIDISGLSNGVYSIIYADVASPENKLVTRLLIAK